MSDVNAQITNAMESALNPQSEVPAVTTPTEVQTQVSSTPAAINLSDDALVTYKVGKEEFTRPWQEILKTQVLLPGDYTRKTQAHAQQVSAWEAQKQSEAADSQRWQQERQQVIAALSDPQKVGALYLAALSKAKESGQSPAQAQQTAQAAVDPTQILSQIDERLNQKFNEYQTNVASQQIASDMDQFVSTLKKDSPLADLPGVDDYLYSQVHQMQPKDPAQAKEYLKLVFEDYNSKFSAKLVNAQKASLVSKEKLNNGIEPPGGTLVPQGQKTYKGPKDPERRIDMLTFMQQQLAQG